MSVSFLFGPLSKASSSSCDAWCIAASGFRISCAILAVRRPSDASLTCWNLWLSWLASSRKTSVGLSLPAAGSMRLKPGCRSGKPWLCDTGLCWIYSVLFCQSQNRSYSSSDSCFSVTCMSRRDLPSRLVAALFAIAIVPLESTTRMPVRILRMICSFICIMLCSSRLRSLAICSVSRMRLAITDVRRAKVNMTMPRIPVCR